MRLKATEIFSQGKGPSWLRFEQRTFHVQIKSNVHHMWPSILVKAKVKVFLYRPGQAHKDEGG